MSGHDEQDLSELERALAGLRPAAPFNRDRLLFEAGRTAARRRRWLWPATSALTSAVAAGLGAMLLLRPAPALEVRLVYVERPPVAAPSPKPAPAPRESEAVPAPAPVTASSIWQIQQSITRHGIDDVPEPGPSPAATSSGIILSAWDWRPRPATVSSRINEGVE